jgi:hypothetical protein
MAGSNKVCDCSVYGCATWSLTKWGAALERYSDFYQRRPYNPLVHLVSGHLLAVFLRNEIKGQGGLFHVMYFLRKGLHQAHIYAMFFRVFLKVAIQADAPDDERNLRVEVLRPMPRN